MKLLDAMNSRIHTASRLLVAAAAGLMFAGSAMAENLGTAFTDLWYTQGEPGWGVTVDHQQNVMFLTFYVYRADGSPYWATAVLLKVSGSTPAVFTGDVFENRGTWFGGQFHPANIAELKVGTATFTAPNVYAATLQYSINGVTVTKNMQRLTLQHVNHSGSYLLLSHGMMSNCQNPALNGTVISKGIHTDITQSGTSFQMVQTTDDGGSCTFKGTYAQSGAIGSVIGGTASCSNGNVGTFEITNMQWTLAGVTASYKANVNGCSYSASWGGVSNR